MAAGDYAAAVRLLEKGRDDLAALGMLAYRSTHTAHLANALYLEGRLDDAEHMAAEAQAETAPDDIINLIIIPVVRAHRCRPRPQRAGTEPRQHRGRNRLPHRTAAR